MFILTFNQKKCNGSTNSQPLDVLWIFALDARRNPSGLFFTVMTVSQKPRFRGRTVSPKLEPKKDSISRGASFLSCWGVKGGMFCCMRNGPGNEPQDSRDENVAEVKHVTSVMLFPLRVTLVGSQEAKLGVAVLSAPSSETFLLCKWQLGHSLSPVSLEGRICGEKEA